MSVPRILVVPLLLVACGKPKSTPPTTPPVPKKEVSTAPSKPVEAPEKQLTQEEAFAQAMPATVLVTTAWGHGTGVFIDPSGLVLTNNHVVATGKNEDFGISATITIPEVQPDGSVKPGERFHAVALEIDEKRDLAILRIVDAKDRKFPALSISQKDPQVGTKVFALGNAGVGLGWALKRCSINAVGGAEAQMSAIFQMQREDISAEERQMSEDAIKKAAADGGKQIQTDCSILPGDSGGPLVDETTGKLVGLNVAIRTAFSSYVSLGSLAFHIHAQELRDFTKEIPKNAQVFLPDPWVGSNAYGSLTDFDQDGEIDSLSVMGSCGENLTCTTSFADVDENSFRGKTTLPTFAELQTSKKFDAELAVLRQARMPRKPSGFMVPVSDTLAWLDTNDNGKFDRLIVADGETGSVRGYKLGKAGPERDAALDNIAVADVAALYNKEKLRPEITRFANALVAGNVELRDPAVMRAMKARLADYTDDKQPDTLLVDTRLDKRVIVDVDQTGLAKVNQAALRSTAPRTKGPRHAADYALVKQLREGRVHGDVLAVLGAPTRVYYDTDHDGDFDLMLEGASIESGVTLGAATIDGGKLSPVMEHVGRRLLRPGLLTDKARAAKLEPILGKAFPGAPHANAKDDASSFPPPMPKSPLAASPVGDFGNHVLSVSEIDGVVILMDLDKSSFHGKNAKKDPLELVKSGKFDAEVSVRFANGMALASIDANNDGKFDVVYVASGWDPKRISLAYKLGKNGAEIDKSKEGGQTFDPKHLKSAAQGKVLDEIVKKLFP